MTDWINIALPKGRLGEKAYAMLKRSGYGCPSLESQSRKLWKYAKKRLDMGDAPLRQIFVHV